MEPWTWQQESQRGTSVIKSLVGVCFYVYALSSDSGFGARRCLFSEGWRCHGSLFIHPITSTLFCLFIFPSPSSDGLAAFRAFLRTEFSEENLDFWLACDDYKKIKSQSKMASKAKKIFAEFIAIQSCKEVSMKSHI